MKTIHGIFVVVVVLLSLSYSCERDPQRPDATVGDYDVQYLLQSWTRSYEEEPLNSPIQIYRPSGFKQFPPSWFRMRYVFNEDRTCEWFVLHPSDMHFMTPGTWGIDPQNNKIVLIYDMKGTLKEAVSFEIVELENDLLRIEVGIPSPEDV